MVLASLVVLLVGLLGGGPHSAPVGSIEPLEAVHRFCVLYHWWYVVQASVAEPVHF